jgi:hypothetical protein
MYRSVRRVIRLVKVPAKNLAPRTPRTRYPVTIPARPSFPLIPFFQYLQILAKETRDQRELILARLIHSARQFTIIQIRPHRSRVVAKRMVRGLSQSRWFPSRSYIHLKLNLTLQFVFTF